jgi:hypothetical protein
MYLNSTLFSQGWNVRPEYLFDLTVSPGDGLAVLDNGIYAYDFTAATAVLDHIGGRPCINLTNSGSTATDVANAQVNGNSMQFVAGKQFVMKGSVRFTTISQDFAMATWATDTNYFSTLPTDYLGLEKVVADTVPYITARKASGTAERYPLNTAVIAIDTWYDYAVKVDPDPATAGKALVQVAWGASVLPGNPIPIVFNGSIATQMPDTVDSRPGFAWRAGSAANVSCYIGVHGFRMQA